MRNLLWIGLVVIVLGIVSLFVPIPHNERHGIRAGDVSIGFETRTDEKVSPAVSAVLIAGGAGMIIAAKMNPGRSS